MEKVINTIITETWQRQTKLIDKMTTNLIEKMRIDKHTKKLIEKRQNYMTKYKKKDKTKLSDGMINDKDNNTNW